jgi:hypothetical protein
VKRYQWLFGEAPSLEYFSVFPWTAWQSGPILFLPEGKISGMFRKSPHTLLRRWGMPFASALCSAILWALSESSMPCTVQAESWHKEADPMCHNRSLNPKHGHFWEAL